MVTRTFVLTPRYGQSMQHFTGMIRKAVTNEEGTRYVYWCEAPEDEDAARTLVARMNEEEERRGS